MGLLGWVVLGGIAGAIASAIMGEHQGCLSNVLIGIIGALVGGLVFQAIGQQPLTGFNFWSVFVATIGSLILIAVFRALRSPQA